VTKTEAKRLRRMTEIAQVHALVDRYISEARAAKARVNARPRSEPSRKEAEETESHAERTARVRQEVWARAGGVWGHAPFGLCECGCGRGVSRDTFQMDHWIGAAKRKEMTTIENCWALHRDCHNDKGGPDVDKWNQLRKAFCEKNGLPFIPRKPTRYYAKETP
jgi:5-methylcytosine-specific restriction endonuclease McrA